MVKQYFIYILSNYTRTVLYIGVTNNLIKRVCEHKEELADSFTKLYHVHDLVYFEIYATPQEAIEREKQLKKWSRTKKDSLIKEVNPFLKDLYETLL